MDSHEATKEGADHAPLSPFSIRWRRDADTLDTDRSRLDMARIADWIRESYWASGRSRALVERSWAHSAVVAGLFHGEELVGCARVVTDFAAVAYLADVFVVEEHRGRGLGVWLVECLVAHPELAGLRWLLHTRDAHAVYRKVGFGPPGERVMERPRPGG